MLVELYHISNIIKLSNHPCPGIISWGPGTQLRQDVPRKDAGTMRLLVLRGWTGCVKVSRWIQWFKDVYVYIYIYIYFFNIYIYTHNSHYWNPPISGWWLSPTHLKNMKVSWDDYSQLNETIKNVPNHQPYIYIWVICVNPPTLPQL